MCPTASFLLLVVSSFNYFKIHAGSKCMLLFLHSSFKLSMVKMLLNLEVGGRALNSHENYIVDHGKIMNCVFEFLWEPCLVQVQPRKTRKVMT